MRLFSRRASTVFTSFTTTDIVSFMSTALAHNASWWTMQYTMRISCAQPKERYWSMSSCESPLVDPTMTGAPSVVTETSFDRSKPLKAGKRALRTSWPVVFPFIGMRRRNSSTTYRSSLTPRTKMDSCAVSLILQLSSKAMENTSRVLKFVDIEDRTSEAKSSTRRVTVRADSGIALKSSCCSGQMTSKAASTQSITKSASVKGCIFLAINGDTS